MLLNHLRQTVQNSDPDVPSLCPDCKDPLIARRGDVMVWHWAHKAGSSCGCGAGETKWHLAWKHGYNDFQQWSVEVPITIDGKMYRADAMNTETGKIREFVHSLSASYIQKHLDLKQAGYDVLWILDGDKFTSVKKKRVGKPDQSRMYQKFMKPTARDLCISLGDNCMVHYRNKLFKHWKGGVWVEVASGTTRSLLERFNANDGGEKLRELYDGFGEEYYRIDREAIETIVFD